MFFFWWGALFFPFILFYNLFCVGLYGFFFFFFGFSDFESKALGLGVRLDTAEYWKLKLKIEKYCSKIIFKYMNSTVGPIFNEKIAEKWNLWIHEQCTMCTDWLKKWEKSNFAATVHWTVHEQ